MLRCTTARAGRSDHDTHLSWGGVNTASFCASQSTPPGVESNSRWDEDIPHAGSDETFCSLRKVAAARARGARRPSGAEEGVCGEQAEPQTARREPAPARSWRLPRAWPGGARAACDRRGRVSLLPPPSLRSDGEPSWGRVPLPHQQKRAEDLRWSSSAHSECLTCGRARYENLLLFPAAVFGTGNSNAHQVSKLLTPWAVQTQDFDDRRILPPHFGCDPLKGGVALENKPARHLVRSQ